MRTDWVIDGSEGYDALAFLAPLAGDPFYTRYYEAEVAELAPRLRAGTLDEIRALRDEVAATDGLLSPTFYLVFSGGPTATIEDLLASLADPEGRLRPRYEASPYWEDAAWDRFVARRDRLRAVLEALGDAGFAAFRRERYERAAAEELPELRRRFAESDVVAEVERYTGRTFDPRVDVVLLAFCKPHGARVLGQVFLTATGYPPEITIQTAVHELLHPPVDMRGPTATAALEVLGRDELLARIVAEHDPAFGYTTLDGLLDEDLVEAIDQVITERLGIGRDPARRFTTHDDGMHVLAVALYGLLRRTGFAATGGDLEAWLAARTAAGDLEPATLHAVAADVLGRRVDRLWPVPAAVEQAGAAVAPDAAPAVTPEVSG